MLLVGDIGGTHARLCLLEPSGRMARREVFDSRSFRSLAAVAETFLATAGKPRVTAACFGVAGPVVKNRCVATNLPWVIDGAVLSRQLKIRRVTLLNDLVALALGAIDVPPSKRRVLGLAGAPHKHGANVAVIAAGTGLGEALLVWDGARFVPSATEGGHVEFGPRNDVEIELLRFSRARFGHVSYERLVSGAGLGHLYDFFREGQGMFEDAVVLAALAAAPDRNAAIAALAAQGKSAAAARAVDLFVSIYGAEAGNLALKSLSLGGVLVCGGIAASMLPVLEKGFMEAFLDKGRFTSLMEKIPVAVVTDTDIGLAGTRRVVLGKV